jgi:hypothetical protein
MVRVYRTFISETCRETLAVDATPAPRGRRTQKQTLVMVWARVGVYGTVTDASKL